jgi:hypothetical protein
MDKGRCYPILPLFPDSVINAIPTATKKIPNAMAKYNIVVSFKFFS